MKQLITILFLGFFTSACVPFVDTTVPTPTLSQSVVPTIMVPHVSLTPFPSATALPIPVPSATPIQTSTSLPTATLTPMPVSTETPWWWEDLQGFEELLPVDAEFSYEKIWEWAMRRGCTYSSAIIFVPYRLPVNKWNIIAIAGQDRNTTPAGLPSIYWDWQEETMKPDYWQEIRYLASLRGDGMGKFLGLDEHGQWWVVGIMGACEEPSVSAMFPVINPENVSFEVYSFGEESYFGYSYWIVDGSKLTVYELKSDLPTILWTLDNVPDIALLPGLRYDYTGDGEPDLVLFWGSGLLQIYQSEGNDFKQIGEVETSYHQYSDVDGDSIGEFLWPIPEDNPTEWKVYGWNGEQFIWKGSLPKPVINATTIDSPIASSDCPFHLIEVGHYEGSSYNVSNSDESINWEIPNTFTYVRGHSTFTWDENCRFLIHARADSGGGGLYRLDLNSGNVETLLSLPGSPEDSRGYGAVQPIALANGDIIFTIQGQDATLYPPLGIYQFTADGDLRLLVDIPPLLSNEENPDFIQYGNLTRLSTGEFVYQSP